VDWGEDPDGATPLTEEQRQGLKLSWISTREELNDAEAENILAGVTKWQRRRLSFERLLDDKAVRDLHRDLFGQVWSWAGAYRTSELNIGIAFYQVPMAVRDLTQDAVYWFDDGSRLSTDEAAARYHHRLVQIHPFPNGNGRHAREMTDLILAATGAEPFTWGRRDLGRADEVRKDYIDALRAADSGEYDALLEFVRS
jgi:Fic-DOC domain mobile mystery protein B